MALGEAIAFGEPEMDKIIRHIVDKVRRKYFENGETARGIPAAPVCNCLTDGEKIRDLGLPMLAIPDGVVQKETTS